MPIRSCVVQQKTNRKARAVSSTLLRANAESLIYTIGFPQPVLFLLVPPYSFYAMLMVTVLVLALFP